MTDKPIYIFDHEDRAAGDLISALRRPLLLGLVRAFARQVQELEDAAYSCIGERFLSAAAGAQLDAWGEVVGERRGGLHDIDYRRFLSARIIYNTRSRTPETIIHLAGLWAHPVARVRYRPIYPAHFRLEVERDGSSALVFWGAGGLKRVRALVSDLPPSGVSCTLVEAREGYFGFRANPRARGFNVGRWSRAAAVAA